MGRFGFNNRGGGGGDRRGGGGGGFRGRGGFSGGNRGGMNRFGSGGNRNDGSFQNRSDGGFQNRNSGGGGGGFRGRGSPRGRGFSRGGRGSPRGGGGGGGMRGGKQVIVKPHRFEGVFIVGGKEDALATLNLVPGESIYGEKRINVAPDADSDKSSLTEYRVWNPFRSKLAAAIMAGIGKIHISPGLKVLYLGAASGTTVSHVSDIVGSSGIVYAVEFSNRSGRDLLGISKKRTNIVPIVEDARHPHKYSMIVGAVDTIFADVAQPNQAQIVIQNAQKFLKNNGHAVISIKANCVDSTAEPEAVFSAEVETLKSGNFKPLEQISLEPYERDHAVVVAVYRPSKKTKQED